ncbi:hypothetical protein VR010_13585 [Actinomycetaceae bacterium L2_0104]
MRKQSKRSRSRSRVEASSVLKATALIVLTLVVLVLCFLAIKHGRGDASAAEATSRVTSAPSAPSASANTGPSEPGESGGGDSPAEAFSPAPQLIVATGEDSAYRAIAGSCPEGGSSIAVTEDGGATWASFDVGARLGIGAIQSVRPGNTGYASFVGQNLADCSSASAGQTYTSGNDWEVAAGVLEVSWYIDPTDSQMIMGPESTPVEAPCALRQLTSNGNDSVAGLCTDGRVVSSSDAGASWTESEPIEGIDAMAFAGDRVLTTALGNPACAEGVAIRSLDSSLAVTGEQCAPDLAATAGQTSISESPDGTLWLLADENVRRSSDNGASWR